MRRKIIAAFREQKFFGNMFHFERGFKEVFCATSPRPRSQPLAQDFNQVVD
jgi:hypothetical protein